MAYVDTFERPQVDKRVTAQAVARPRFAGSRQWTLARFKSWTLALLLPVVLLALWQALTSAGVFAEHLVPSPAAVGTELILLWQSGDLVEHLGVTLGRVALGFLAGLVSATVVGVLCGYAPRARDLLDPTIQALKAVPSLAWVPLFILWFGIFETSKISLIAVGVFFPIYLNLLQGILGVDRKLVEVARINGLSRFRTISKILIPATLPAYFSGLRGGLALGWMFVIAAELMGASSGLGYLMIDGQMTGHPALIVASLLLFAIAGKASDAILAALGRRLTHWQDSFGDLQGDDGHA
jgi:sulfonate transport system permease protein